MILIHLSMENTSGEMARYGDMYFHAFDVNGVSHDPEYINADCILESSVVVLPGGVLRGCIAFEVPDTGNLRIVYAPPNLVPVNPIQFSWGITYSASNGPRVLTPAIRISSGSSARPQFDNVFAYSYPGHIIGEMHYIGDQPLNKVNVEITTYDAQGTLLETLEGVTWQEGIIPGEKVIFYVDPEKSSWDLASIGLSVSAEIEDPSTVASIYKDFQVKGFELQQTDNGWYKMIGDIENIGNSEVNGLGINVIAYDKTGNIVGYDQGTAGYEKDSFKPGETSPIDGQMRINHPDGLKAVDHFEFIFICYS